MKSHIHQSDKDGTQSALPTSNRNVAPIDEHSLNGIQKSANPVAPAILVYYLTTTPLTDNTKGPAMKNSILALTIALAAGVTLASPSHAAPAAVTTLETVQVRPDAEQRAQQAWEQASTIPTLAAVQVRPSAEQIASLQSADDRALPMTTLAAVQVRPSLEQRLALAAEVEASRYATVLTAAATTLAHEVIVNLPAVQVRPSAAQWQALAMETAQVLARP